MESTRVFILNKAILLQNKVFSCGSAGKESICNAGDLGSIPGLGRSPGEGKAYALQYSSLENSIDCILHGVAKSWTWLSDFHFHFKINPLDCKEIKPVHPKGNQSWIFIGRTDAETPIFWPPDVKNWLLRKDPDAGKDWRQEEKGTTEDEMVGWHHQLDGHEIEQALGVGDGQGSLACCSPWGHKESDTTEHTHTHAYHGISRIAIAVCTWDFALYLNSFLKVTNIFKTNKTSHFRSRKDRRDHLLHTSQISNWIEGQFAMEEWKVESRIWVLFSDHHSFSVITILMVCCNNEYCSRNSLLLLHYIAISFYRFSFYHLHLGSTQNSLPDSHPFAVCDLPPWSSFSHLNEATDASHLSSSSFCISPTSRITYSHHWHRAKCLELNLVFFI